MLRRLGLTLCDIEPISITVGWEDYTQSDPIDDVRQAVTRLRERSNLQANVAFLAVREWLLARRHPDLCRFLETRGVLDVATFCDIFYFQHLAVCERLSIGATTPITWQKGAVAYCLDGDPARYLRGECSSGLLPLPLTLMLDLRPDESTRLEAAIQNAERVLIQGSR